MTIATDGKKVAITLPSDKFGEFLVDLLGKRQIIEGRLFRKFSVKHEDIDNFYLMLIQRIEEQNKLIASFFSVRYIYNDGSSRELNSYDKFKEYYEPRAVVCTKATLSLVLIAKFENKDIPEKQSIDIEFNISAEEDIPNLILDASGIINPRKRLLDKGMIRYRIEHTSISWGNDIENIVKNHIINISQARSKLLNYLIQNSGFFDGFAHVSHFIFIFLISIIMINNFNILSFSAISDAKIDNISNLTLLMIFSMTFVLGIKYLFTQMYFEMFYIINKMESNDSFILVTDEGEKYRNRQLKIKSRRKIHFILQCCLNIGISIVANIIFAYYSLG